MLQVTQVQTESSCCIPDRLYAVDVVNSNENIPYADNFEVLVHHCLLRYVTNNLDKLIIQVLHLCRRRLPFN